MDWVDQVAMAGGGLDRMAGARAGAARLLAAEGARVLPLWQGRVLLSGEGLGWIAPDHPLLEGAAATLFLGGSEAAPLFAADVTAFAPPEGGEATGWIAEDLPVTGHEGLGEAPRFADLRGLLTVLDPLDAECAATARGMFEWHRSHGFCANCGAPSALADGGWRRDCAACGRPHFPRTDPVAIMLITHRGRVLVGRSPGWPEGMFSLLAGFMEPGETVAAAVRREVMEEAGVPVGAVRMIATQPWPFPASLMIGCAGEALDDTITIDPAEIEEARWLSREELVRAFAGTHPEIRAPRTGAIAGMLLKMYLADRVD